MTAPDRETLAAAVGEAHWPDGTHIEGLTSKVCGLIADALLAGPLAPRPVPEGGGMPEEVREQANEAALRGLAVEALDADTAHLIRYGAQRAAEVTYLAGRADERAAVVAWLRQSAGLRFVDGFPRFSDVAWLLEEGKHLRGEHLDD